MGRDVKVRASYQMDAAYLTRLSRAVEIDERQTVTWRRSIIARLNELIVEFLKTTDDRLNDKEG